MTLFPKATPFRPLLRDVEVAVEAAASPAVAVDVVVTCVLAGLFLKRKFDKVTNVKAKRYPTDVYNSFIPAQKAKHWQLMNPGKTPGSGPAKGARIGTDATVSGMSHQIAEFKTTMSSAVTAILVFTAATQKHTANDEESDLTRDSGWGRPCGDNRDNPALARQEAGKKPKN